MPARSRALQVLVAVPSPAVARGLSEDPLARRLCACAQTLGPVTSRYRWKGKLETAREWLLVLKTRSALQSRVEREIRRAHPYEVPEILSVPLVGGHAPYLAWLRRECVNGRDASSRPR